ncbi:MAG: UDP-N-acetylglucosamine 2-epimerase (non-hydrolyzing) [Planctomycetes bacterium]|nr:UDP-N-acetylglucosamine 2-epimerase (non-hydrolyzing) [Planctomycetota bacterium]
MKKLAVILGTRPEVVKLAPVIREARASKAFELEVWSTGQHREMLEDALSNFGIAADLDLALMTHNQSLGALTGRILERIEEVLVQRKPDALMVQGDTTTVFAASLAAFYNRIPVAHVEAGLRSYDMLRPYPEELNRRVTSLLTSWHYAPTAKAKANLLREGVSEDRVLVTGNTVIDALLWTSELVANDDLSNSPELAQIDFSKPVVIITAHRRESHGAALEDMCRALGTLADEFQGLEFVYFVHPNPNVKKVAESVLGKSRVKLAAPVGYRAFVWMLRRAKLILTDSGGIQEEAPSLHVPVVVMRDCTERPEVIDCGAAVLGGTTSAGIIEAARNILRSDDVYKRMASAQNPFGDGKAAKRIVESLEAALS